MKKVTQKEQMTGKKFEQLEEDKIEKLARRGLGSIRGLDLKRANGVESPIGRIVIAPPKELISSEKEAEKGAIIGGVYLEQTPPDACVTDGAYSVKLLKRRGSWKAQLIQKGKVMTSLDDVEVFRFEDQIERPVVMRVGVFEIVIISFCVGYVVGWVARGKAEKDEEVSEIRGRMKELLKEAIIQQKDSIS